MIELLLFCLPTSKRHHFLHSQTVIALQVVTNVPLGRFVLCDIPTLNESGRLSLARLTL